MPPRRSLRSSGADDLDLSRESQISSSQTIQNESVVENDIVQESEQARFDPAPRRGSKFQPKSNIRRSQLERDAQEKAESERRKVQDTEARRLIEIAERAKGRDNRGRGRGQGRGRGDFRGGLSGWRNESQATGFLGSGVAQSKSSTAPKRRQGDGSLEQIVNDNDGSDDDGDDVVESTAQQAEGAVAQRAAQTARIPSTVTGVQDPRTSGQNKGKSKAKPSTARNGGTEDASGVSKVKKEEDTDVTMTDADLLDTKININIDELAYVNLISEDEEDVDAAGNPQRSFNPVRIHRKQHIERKPIVENTASSEVSEQVRKEARAKGVSVADVQIIASDDGMQLKTVENRTNERPRRNREKAKQTGGIRSEDVKQEDDATLPIVAADPSRSTADSSTRIAVEVPDDDDPADLLPHKIRSRRRYPPIFTKPLLQTAEDHTEWARRQKDLKAIAEEFGNDAAAANPVISTENSSSARDSQEPTTGRRDNKVYLFQLPPVMPNLCTSTEAAAHKRASHTEDLDRNEPSGNSRGYPPPTRPPNPNVTQDTDVKIEDDNHNNTSSKQVPINLDTSVPLDLALDAGMMPPHFKGRIGTLTVYENGSTELDWAGIPFELDRGMGEMLQETLLVDHESKTGISMSQVAANFIVKPSWDRLLEGEE